ncbi:hypothetical protein NDU88_007066 [Pleurodeles waltl]|uniref:Uncharacterized protein n=1 Tax=Pleurodeles waltl TaxID=8319 RepID=A0AAV7M1W2_PLEWA|nr:hypothetical protein NDU88_007066 [Pleurodeles waltl]
MDTETWLLGHGGQDANIGQQTETQALGGDGHRALALGLGGTRHKAPEAETQALGIDEHRGVAPGTRRTRRKHWKADGNTSTGGRLAWGRGSRDTEDQTQTLESRQKHKDWVEIDTGAWLLGHESWEKCSDTGTDMGP